MQEFNPGPQPSENSQNNHYFNPFSQNFQSANPMYTRVWRVVSTLLLIYVLVAIGIAFYGSYLQYKNIYEPMKQHSSSKQQTCFYDGQTYQVGEGFPSSDGCNICSCGESGDVACTLMACEGDQEPIEIGETPSANSREQTMTVINNPDISPKEYSDEYEYVVSYQIPDDWEVVSQENPEKSNLYKICQSNIVIHKKTRAILSIFPLCAINEPSGNFEDSSNNVVVSNQGKTSDGSDVVLIRAKIDNLHYSYLPRLTLGSETSVSKNMFIEHRPPQNHIILHTSVNLSFPENTVPTDSVIKEADQIVASLKLK